MAEKQALIELTNAAVALECIVEGVLPGSGSIAKVREDIVKLFEQRMGSKTVDSIESIETLRVLLAINQERYNQRTGKYDNAHDDTHTDGELARFAAALIVPEETYRLVDPKTLHFVSLLPIEEDPAGDGDGGKSFRPWHKPEAKDKDRVDIYIKAAAVLVAEIERLLRVREVERCAKEAKRLATGGLVVKGTRTDRVRNKKSNSKNRKRRRSSAKAASCTPIST